MSLVLRDQNCRPTSSTRSSRMVIVVRSSARTAMPLRASARGISTSSSWLPRTAKTPVRGRQRAQQLGARRHEPAIGERDVVAAEDDEIGMFGGGQGDGRLDVVGAAPSG